MARVVVKPHTSRIISNVLYCYATDTVGRMTVKSRIYINGVNCE